VTFSDYDVVIAGTKAKLAPAEGRYKRRFVRQEVQNNLLSQSQTPAMVSRGDRSQMYQTSWAGGSRWWKPLITPTDMESYFQSNHMDTWSEPGKIVPTNQVVDAANTNLHDNCVIAAGTTGAVYAIGNTEDTDTGFFDVYVWTPASNAFVRDSAQNSGVDDDDEPLGMVFDPTDGYFYIITTDDVVRFTPTGDDEDAGWLDITATIGANIFTTPYGLMFYDGTSIYSIAKAGPTATEEFDDGMGTDLLNGVTFTGSPLYRKNLRLAISTPEGIYYVKNTRQGGLPVPFVFRVDRDSAGNFIGNPIATLPAGTVALSIAHHLGSIVISASPDWQTVADNDAVEAEITLYHITQGSMGALGSLLGGRDALDETPFAILGSAGPLLYIGGHKRLWIYDAIRGGLHTAWSWGTELANGPYTAMASVLDSAGAGAMIFLGADRIARIKATQNDNPDTVTNFGDDEAHYVLTSNFFDCGLPMETKELTKVAILREAGDGEQEYTIQISADGAAFADALVHSTSGEVYEEADLSGTTGIKFQYRVIYQTKDTNRNALEALLVTHTTGEIVEEIELVLDGSELLNVDNEVQDEEAFYDALVAIAGTATQINFVDNYKEQDQLSDTATTRKMKVVAVEIHKEKPGESTITVVLREP
jgi:hypothetical protein